MLFIKSEIDQNFILSCYEKDLEHVENTYVINDKSPSSCAKDTANKLNQKDRNGNIAEFYYIEEEGVKIGFFAINRIDDINILRSFYIIPEFRTLATKFLDMLKKDIPQFISTIYNTNHKAIGFFNRNGGDIVNIKEVDFRKDIYSITFKFKQNAS